MSLLTLAVALGLSGLDLVWVTIAAFLVLVGIPEITAVIVDNVFNEAVPSRHRAGLLSMIAFVESALIGIGYRRGTPAGMSPVAPGALPRGTGDHRDREARRPKGVLKQGRTTASVVDGLDTLLVAACPVLEWQAIVHDNSGGSDGDLSSHAGSLSRTRRSQPCRARYTRVAPDATDDFPLSRRFPP